MGHDSASERILLVRGDGMGDAVLGTALLAGLRAGRPDAHITLALREPLLPLLGECPWVDALLPFPSPEPSMGPVERGILTLSTTRALQKLVVPFDVVVDMQRWTTPFGGSMHVTATIPARRRIGAPMAQWDAQLAMSSLYDEILEIQPCHEVLRCNVLSQHLGGEVAEPALWDLPRHRRQALGVLGRDEAWWRTPKAFIHVGASDPRRRWPVERFGEIAARLAGQDVEVVVLGEQAEAQDVLAVAARAGEMGLPLPGTLTPLQVAAVMQGGGLFVGNDSGPMHLAAVAGLSVVEVSMHPTTGRWQSLANPEWIGPWGVPAAIVQPDDFLPGCGPELCQVMGAHCITQVDVEQVWDAVRTLVDFDPEPERVQAGTP